MPDVGESLYCSEQICIPPTFPYLLRQYAKAAIRTQPTDLLKWSTTYFRCLAINIPPPVKPRLEYPIPKDHFGVTPGWLKALLYQLQNNQTISFKVLWDRWVGACLEHKTLIQILCLGGFTDPMAIPWLRFIGLCAAHLTDDLTHSMILICEILTEEPEGGSAMITLETFLDLYQFLADIDASKPQVLKNMYFLDDLLGLWKDKIEKQEAIEEKAESIVEEESISLPSEKSKSSEEEVKVDLGKVVSCPSIQSSDESAGMLVLLHEDLFDNASITMPETETFLPETVVIRDLDELENEEDVGEHEEEQEVEFAETVSKEETEILSAKESEKDIIEMGEEVEVEQPLTEEKTESVHEYESVDTFFETPRKIFEDVYDEEEVLKEDLERLKTYQEELPGEGDDDEIEKFKCQLIAEMPMTESQRSAIGHYDKSGALSIEDKEEKSEKSESLEDLEEIKEYEDVYVDAIHGIGGVVPAKMVEAVGEYMRDVAKHQNGMVMPRNVKHFSCPPLEQLEC